MNRDLARPVALLALALMAVSPHAYGQADAPESHKMAAVQQETAAQVEAHIKSLHDRLGITPAEQPQWDHFAQVMRANATDMQHVAVERGDKLQQMNAVETMSSYAHLAQAHAENMQKLSDAFQALYQTFPDPQKAAADKMFRAKAEDHARKARS